jgi:hypothetical protein
MPHQGFDLPHQVHDRDNQGQDEDVLSRDSWEDAPAQEGGPFNFSDAHQHSRPHFRASEQNFTHFLVDRLMATQGWKMMTPLLIYVRSLLKYAASSRAVDDAEVSALPTSKGVRDVVASRLIMAMTENPPPLMPTRFLSRNCSTRKSGFAQTNF